MATRLLAAAVLGRTHDLARDIPDSSLTMAALFLAGYIVLVGVATFLMKYAMKDFTPYQVNFVMAIGMLVTAVGALLAADRSFAFQRKGLALLSAIGVLMGIGSVLYALALNKLPAGLAAAVATSYVVVVIALSRIVLQEHFDVPKIIGLALTLSGVALLSFKS
jgi:drug/metabolite transporter (DMT)-like permease